MKEVDGSWCSSGLATAEIHSTRPDELIRPPPAWHGPCNPPPLLSLRLLSLTSSSQCEESIRPPPDLCKSDQKHIIASLGIMVWVRRVLSPQHLALPPPTTYRHHACRAVAAPMLHGVHAHMLPPALAQTPAWRRCLPQGSRGACWMFNIMSQR